MTKLLRLLPFLLFLFLASSSVHAQVDSSDEVITRPAPNMKDICEFDPTDRSSFHFVRHEDVAGKAASAIPTSTFTVDYEGDWPAEAIDAFEHALRIWETHLQSPVPIAINASWEELEGLTLGSAGPTLISTVPQSAGGEPETWYAIAQASAMTGVDQKGTDADHDINVTMNSDFDDWYFGTDGNTPQGLIDFVTVVLHEVGHGIGFIGSVSGDEDEEIASWGFGETGDRPPWPIVYDLPVEDGDQNMLVNNEAIYPNPSSSLYEAATGQRNGVFFLGESATQANFGTAVRLFAPDPWEGGSSYSHVDEADFTGTENELMRPRINRANSVHTPGPVVCGMLDDWGWPIGIDCLELIGVEARIVVDTDELDFGVSNVGSTRELTFTIENREDAEDPLRGRVEVEGNAFSVIGGGRSYSIDPGRTEDFTVRYRPENPTEHSGEVRITHNGDNEASPVLIDLEGRALEQDKIVELEQSYPNPINPNEDVLQIPYALAVEEPTHVSLELFNSAGQRVAQIFEGEQGEGEYVEAYNARELASGVYLYRIIVGNAMETRKLTIIK